MLRLLTLLIALMGPAIASAQSVQSSAPQDVTPDRRLNVTRDVDFYGSDLQALFDTNFEACQRACLAKPDCVALTFNARSNACFPKSAITQEQPYEGAMSARVIRTAPALRTMAAQRAADLGFLGSDAVAAARQQALNIGVVHAPGAFTTGDYITAAQTRESSGDTSAAMQFYGAAVALDDSADLWVDYARLSLAAAQKDKKGAYRLRIRARDAAINAYLRTSVPPQQAWALFNLAQALEQLGDGRAMIPTLRLAQSHQRRDDAADLLDAAIGKYGFRVADHSVESDLPSPRICARFSEDLVAAGVDYAPFVRSETAGLAVEATGSQLCLTGVTHGTSYRITLRSGLPAASGEVLAKDVDLTLYVRDRAPSLRFSGRAYVLPRTNDPALPITSVNTDQVDLALYRVSDRNLLSVIRNDLFARPLQHWELDALTNDQGTKVWQGTGTVQMRLNTDMTTRLPLSDALAGQDAGIYALQAAVPGMDESDVTQWFVLSDLGMTSLTGTDGLHVFVRGLSDAGPRAGVTMTLLSRANAVLGQVDTDAAGYARFEPGLMRGEHGAAPAMVLAETDGDIGFLSLTDPEFDLSDRGVAGRAPAGPVDVFLATDRGAYRAGDVIYATALARDNRALAIADLPLTAILRRPDGVEYSRALSAQGNAGGHVFDLPIAATAPRGTWQLAISADPDGAPLTSTTLLVEDFMPERIDYDLDLPNDLRAGQTAPLSIAARYLFGAPAGDLPIQGWARVAGADGLAGYSGYRFGRHDTILAPEVAQIAQGARTDAEGQADLRVSLPAMPEADRPLTLTVTAQVSEGSGRPVERQITRDLMPKGALIGIKPLFDGTLSQGAEAAFDVIGLVPEGARDTEIAAEWTINRVETEYQWYHLYGQWNWEPITTRTRVASGDITLTETPTEVAAPVTWGRYELVVTRKGGRPLASSVGFDAGWYAAADAAKTPDTLDLSLDADQYRAGDTAQLRLVPRYAGTALISVLGEGLIDMRAVPVTAGENLIDLTVTEAWGAGVYVSASVIRPMAAQTGQMPARALGLAHAAVDPADRALDVQMTLPDQARPRGPLTIDLAVPAGTTGPVYATVAAIDLGILNLTGFDTPDPAAYYFGQRRLGVGIRDIYGRLIDGLNGAPGVVRSGGDAGASMSMQSPPPTEDLVTFFSGPVALDENGQAQISYDLPAFDGTLRVMAMAWGARGVGSATQDVVIRDPVVMSASLPRFLAPGDTSRMMLEITHADGPAGRVGVDVTTDAGLVLGDVPAGVTLTEGGRAVIEVALSARQVGDPEVHIVLTTPDGTQLVRDLRVPVRANDPEVAVTRRFDLAGGQTFTLSADVFTGLRAGTGRAVLSAGPLARFDAPGLLSALDRYPYGCTEQVASAAMPLLYFDQVARALGLVEGADLTAKVNHAVQEVLSRQAASGGFGLWRAGSGDFWLDAYVTDFLTRAQLAGYAVPQRPLRSALDNLRNRVNYAADFDEGGADIAYALMVLARSGAANMGDLRYYADVKAEAFDTPLALAQLGAALASYGDPRRADRMFGRAAQMLARNTGRETAIWRADYGTDLRDTAGVLALATEAGSTAIDRDALIARLAGTDRTRSTQEAAWTLLAAHHLINDPMTTGLEVDGVPVDGPLVQVLAAQTRTPRAITNTAGATPLTLTTVGVPQVAPPASGYGYQIGRRIYELNGDLVTGDTLVSGQRYAVVVEVVPAERIEARLMVDDPLPAGLEIDNPNLLRSGDVRALDWLNAIDAEHTEFRSDRFLAAVDWRSHQPFRLVYIARAVTPGQYHAPAASVSDMYRPEYRAVGATRTITIAP